MMSAKRLTLFSVLLFCATWVVARHAPAGGTAPAGSETPGQTTPSAPPNGNMGQPPTGSTGQPPTGSTTQPPSGSGSENPGATPSNPNAPGRQFTAFYDESE
jgi:hypothetical protein